MFLRLSFQKSLRTHFRTHLAGNASLPFTYNFVLAFLQEALVSHR